MQTVNKRCQGLEVYQRLFNMHKTIYPPQRYEKLWFHIILFVCVGVMYSGEYNVSDATLSVYPHRAS
jgi:hypothetical protein